MSYLKHGPSSVLRNIVHELRRSNRRLKPMSKTAAYSYLIHEYRCHQVTERRICKSSDELFTVAKTYLCYLQSLRQHQELLKQFYTKGERSVEETARIVGFTLPDSSKEEPTNKNLH